MSVAGLDGPGIELTGLASPGGSSSAVLPPQQQQQQPARQEAPHLRLGVILKKKPAKWHIYNVVCTCIRVVG